MINPGNELRRAREAATISQRVLARRTGTSQATISAYEQGRKQPAIATFERLLEACDARLEVFIPRPPRKSPEQLGREFLQALELAELLPYGPKPDLEYPRLPT